MTRYDTIGHGYASRRREDPALKERIETALGEARTVVNVGAGAGSYESSDRLILPVSCIAHPEPNSPAAEV